MSGKMSRKSVLIAQLADDEKVRDAFKLFAARIVNDSKLSSIISDNYIDGSDSDEDEELSDGESEQVLEVEDEEYDEEEEEEENPGICCDCQCAKRVAHKSKQQLKINSNVSQQKIKQKNEIELKASGLYEDKRKNSEDNESCECVDCQQFECETKKSDENAIKLIAEEDRKKKKSEKKKLQKKKKRDKRKAERQTNLATNEELNQKKTNTVDNSPKTNSNNNNNNNNKKSENSNKQKTDTKTTAKQKNTNKSDKNNTKQDIKQKQVLENKCSADSTKDNSNNTNDNMIRESERLSSNKSSPKTDREIDGLVSDLEEEELSLSSAYVTQIAQRKTKPSYNQKTAQVFQTDAHDYSVYVDDYSQKNANNSDNNSNFSNSNTNSSNNTTKNNTFNTNSNNSQNNNSNNNNNKTNNKEVNEEMPKYKQYFYEQQKQKTSKAAAVQLTKDVKTSKEQVDKSIEFAILANQKAESNKFSEAIELFTQALSFNPNDYRFYVNRSYCFDSIQDFRSALKDAEIAIQLRPDWPKCHYRRGKALAGLKNYQESEIALKKVLTLEKDCDEALSELWHVRYSAIVDTGYDTTTANIYSSQYNSIKEALEALSIKGEKQKSFNDSNGFKKAINSSKNGFISTNNFDQKDAEIWSDDDIYISDDEYNSAVREPTYEETSPTNPFGWKALWIGNVSLNAKLDTVTTMFRKFGNLNYCNIFKGNNGGNFILVHYDNPESPRLAMTKYQSKVIPGVSIADTPLTIRFRPNKDQKKPNYDQRLESDECYYWRTTGCARGDKCLYKHIQANRGVDKQAWMCNPLKKGLQPFHKTQK